MQKYIKALLLRQRDNILQSVHACRHENKKRAFNFARVHFYVFIFYVDTHVDTKNKNEHLILHVCIFSFLFLQSVHTSRHEK